MALPIAPTPVLAGKDAETFLRKVEEGLKSPVGYVATPRIEKVRERALKNAKRGKE